MVYESSASSQRTGSKSKWRERKEGKAQIHPDLDQWPKIRDRTSHRNVFTKLNRRKCLGCEGGGCFQGHTSQRLHLWKEHDCKSSLHRSHL